ncbi:polyhydroxyalkanoate granule-associated phasin [Ideonella sp. A 288]|uniref:polyhydroxyalkanoate granule-associated phasin n=1 Tax=Ideonella sp. A 288 TaxID=1962181 RepID=UPI000B4B5F29|nr:polyhydroxyalkanoate granule-associated phasin [Ideonella sp. A 288]
MRAPRLRKSQSVTSQAAELAMAVPQVVVHRMTRLAMAGPNVSARDRKEFQLMVEEKQAAFTEAWQAMATQSLHAQGQLAASFMQSLWTPASPHSATSLATQMHDATMGVLGKGIAPMHRKAVANAKRLARTRLR